MPGEKYVLGIMLIVAAGIFAIGIMVGIMAVVSHGIHREQKHFQQQRRFREEHGIWAGPDAPEYFLAEEAPDRVSSTVRRLNALYVRHPPSSADHDADLGVRV
jgi:flagellar basal body-associated protein FliL